MERTVSFIFTVLMGIFVASALLSLPYNRMVRKHEYFEALRIAGEIAAEIEAIDRLVAQTPHRIVNYTLNLPLNIGGGQYTVKISQHYVHVILESGVAVNQSLSLSFLTIRPCSFNGGRVYIYYRGGVLYAYNVKG